MKKKKYLIGLALAALSLTTLVACGDDAKPATSEDENSGNGPIVAPTPAEDDTITINVANKEYDSNPATISATAKSGKTVKLEYKLEREDDSKYSTTAPTTPGRYVVKASTEETSDYHAETTTAEFKISTDMLPDEYKQKTFENFSISTDESAMISPAVTSPSPLCSILSVFSSFSSNFSLTFFKLTISNLRNTANYIVLCLFLCHSQ